MNIQITNWIDDRYNGIDLLLLAVYWLVVTIVINYINKKGVK